jgi:hypothetical protein
MDFIKIGTLILYIIIAVYMFIKFILNKDGN